MKFLLFFLALLVVVLAKKQTVKVKGTAICDKKRLPGVTVELWDRDTLDPNDLMASVVTNKEGEFEFEGSESEVTSIEPFLRFKHNCHVKKAGCVRTTEYEVPKKYIDSKDAYDMTYVNLDIVTKVDSEKC